MVVPAENGPVASLFKDLTILTATQLLEPHQIIVIPLFLKILLSRMFTLVRFILLGNGLFWAVIWAVFISFEVDVPKSLMT
jgi:hypothetical protein